MYLIRKESNKPFFFKTKAGYQYLLTLNGGAYNDQAQSASITLECDESQSRSVKYTARRKEKEGRNSDIVVFFSVGKSK